ALSFRFFEMGNTVVKRHGLRQQGAPFLRDLSTRTNEAVNLAILDGDGVIYIDKIESRSTIKVDLSVGKRLPAYCTGLGKVLLAWMPGEKVHELLAPFPKRRFTQNTIVTCEALEESLRTVRKQGYSVDNEEYIEGLVCIAAPVRGRTGEVVAAM
ncbi:MAG TPA: IclR family transcriptional regulator, partial [Synergistaceae bacterium]|nr:IclR family transcriptional regulator [Synergistaceae bacterium]